jgi:glyoxylase-like metal-dependent hydrolase (beta-lactamase superfamily II)
MNPGRIDFTQGTPVPVNLDVRWIHGSRPGGGTADPKIQVHACDPHTFVLRQSKDVHYEAPFLYLFLGNDRALLLDTGATADPGAFPLRETVDGILAGWLASYPRDEYQLVVAHTHGHGDHVAADAQFAGRPDTVMVPGDVASVLSFFQITDWPRQVVPLDLGGRVLEVTGIPGHHVASIVVYDPWTGFLVTGDTVYPGRLFARDMPVFAASMDRLAAFAAARQVTHVMGCHIEMTRTPGRDYPIGARYQPDEPPLQMTVEQLAAVRDATESVASRPGAHVFDDFIIFNGKCVLPVARHAARLAWGKVRRPAPARR